MKHKAQESFERIYQQDYEVFDSSCLVAVEDSDMRYEEDCDTIKELIDCQLTLEELDELLLTLGLKIHDMDYLQIRNDRFYLLNKIIEKVKKQKEMWEEE